MKITIRLEFQTGVSDWIQTGIRLVTDWYQTEHNPGPRERAARFELRFRFRLGSSTLLKNISFYWLGRLSLDLSFGMTRLKMSKTNAIYCTRALSFDLSFGSDLGWAVQTWLKRWFLLARAVWVSI